MTAEIAVLNKEAVALATDSAVTARIANGNKVFTSANKLFALHYDHPVGVMVYNNASFMEIPWETVIKSYRTTLGSKPFAKLEEYTADFLRYLTSNPMLSQLAEEHFVLGFVLGIFGLIRREIEAQVQDVITQTGKIDRAETERVVKSSIDRTLDSWLRAACSEGSMPTAEADKVIERLKDQMEDAIREVFKELPLPYDSREKLNKLAALVLAKGVNQHSQTGLVIAGFGSGDYFPSLQSVTIEGVAGGFLRRNPILTVKIDSGNPGQIIPFAQREMVDRFMEGVDRSYRSLEEKYVSEFCLTLKDRLLAKFGALDPTTKTDMEKFLSETCEQGKEEFTKKVQEAIREKFVSPVMSVIGSLPKNDLALMAESLVSITSLKRQFSAEEETVKGPIDVAVISKYDGFIWIRRKHYFQAELNPHYFGRRLSWETAFEKKTNRMSGRTPH